MKPLTRSALLAACALTAVGVTFLRHPMAIALPEQSWLGAPSPAAVLAWLRSLCGLAVLNLAAFGVGALALRALPAARIAGAEGAARLGLGFAGLAIAALGLAASHWLLPWAIAGTLAASCLAALVLEAPRLRASWSTFRGTLTERRVPALFALLFLAAPALAAFGPNPGWDALTYHLAVPERYLFANGIVVTPFSVFSAFPHATGMLYLLAQFLDGPALAQWVHLEFGVLTAWLAWRMARDASPRAGWLALAALAACPLFAWELGVAYADLSATFYTLLAIRIYAEAAPEHDTRALVAAGVFAGAAAACRYPSWPLVPILVACLWLPGSPVAVGSRARLRASIMLGLGALLPLAPWLVRNAAFTGNPISPLLQAVFAGAGSEYFAPLALEQNAAFLRAIGMGRGLSDLLMLPWNLSFEALAGDYSAFGYRIGALYFVGLAAALIAGHRNPRLYGGSYWWPVGASTLVWFFTSQEPRYLLPVLVLVAVGGSRAVDSLLPTGARARPWLALALLCVAHTQLPILSSIPQRYALATGKLEAPQPDATRLAERMRNELAPDARIAIFFEPRSFYFSGLDYIPYHLGDGSPLLVALHDARESRRLAEFFASLGATHLVLETQLRAITTPRFSENYTRASLIGDLEALERFLARRATRRFSEGSLVLYQLDDLDGAS